jgi:diamine N-acetyltransferase
MDLQLCNITETNFFDVINLKSEPKQEKLFRIFESMVGSNAFFIAYATVKNFINRAIYDGDTLIGFATHGFDHDRQSYELVSIMLGHQFQGKGYGKAALSVILDDMITEYACEEIYLTVVPENEAAIRVYKALGFERTGEVFKSFVEEDVYRYKVSH